MNRLMLTLAITLMLVLSYLSLSAHAMDTDTPGHQVIVRKSEEKPAITKESKKIEKIKVDDETYKVDAEANLDGDKVTISYSAPVAGCTSGCKTQTKLIYDKATFLKENNVESFSKFAENFESFLKTKVGEEKAKIADTKKLTDEDKKKAEREKMKLEDKKAMCELNKDGEKFESKAKQIDCLTDEHVEDLLSSDDPKEIRMGKMLLSKLLQTCSGTDKKTQVACAGVADLEPSNPALLAAVRQIGAAQAFNPYRKKYEEIGASMQKVRMLTAAGQYEDASFELEILKQSRLEYSELARTASTAITAYVNAAQAPNVAKVLDRSYEPRGMVASLPSMSLAATNLDTGIKKLDTDITDAQAQENIAKIRGQSTARNNDSSSTMNFKEFINAPVNSARSILNGGNMKYDRVDSNGNITPYRGADQFPNATFFGSVPRTDLGNSGAKIFATGNGGVLSTNQSNANNMGNTVMPGNTFNRGGRGSVVN